MGWKQLAMKHNGYFDFQMMIDTYIGVHDALELNPQFSMSAKMNGT